MSLAVKSDINKVWRTLMARWRSQVDITNLPWKLSMHANVNKKISHFLLCFTFSRELQ